MFPTAAVKESFPKPVFASTQAPSRRSIPPCLVAVSSCYDAFLRLNAYLFLFFCFDYFHYVTRYLTQSFGTQSASFSFFFSFKGDLMLRNGKHHFPAPITLLVQQFFPHFCSPPSSSRSHRASLTKQEPSASKIITPHTLVVPKFVDPASSGGGMRSGS